MKFPIILVFIHAILIAGLFGAKVAHSSESNYKKIRAQQKKKISEISKKVLYLKEQALLMTEQLSNEEDSSTYSNDSIEDIIEDDYESPTIAKKDEWVDEWVMVEKSIIPVVLPAVIQNIPVVPQKRRKNVFIKMSKKFKNVQKKLSKLGNPFSCSQDIYVEEEDVIQVIEQRVFQQVKSVHHGLQSRGGKLNSILSKMQKMNEASRRFYEATKKL